MMILAPVKLVNMQSMSLGQCANLGMSGWLEAQASMKDGWRSVSMTHGGLYAMTAGPALMPALFAHS